MSHQLGKGFSMGTLSPSLSTRLISYSGFVGSQFVARQAGRSLCCTSSGILFCVETGNISPYYGSFDVRLRKS